MSNDSPLPTRLLSIAIALEGMRKCVRGGGGGGGSVRLNPRLKIVNHWDKLHVSTIKLLFWIIQPLNFQSNGMTRDKYNQCSYTCLGSPAYEAWFDQTDMIRYRYNYHITSCDPKVPGGYSQKNWVGVCGLLPKTLTLFMTKICDFPYPIYDLTLRSLGEGLLLLALSSLRSGH